MTSKAYCWTCKRELPPTWWDRHIVSLRHLRRAQGHPPPFVTPKDRDARELESEDGSEDVEDAGSHDDELPAAPPAHAAQQLPRTRLVSVQLGTGRPQNG